MLKKQIAIAFFGFTLLIFWHVLSKYTCFALLILLFIGMILLKTTFEYGVAKKECFANCFFKKDAAIYKLLTKKAILFFIALLEALFLLFLLALHVILFNIVDFVVLLLDLVLLVWLYNFLLKSNSLKDEMKSPIIINIASVINSVVVVVIILIANLYQPPPSYLDISLMETIRNASHQVGSNCDFVDFILFVANIVAAIKWWVMVKISVVMDNRYHLKTVMWIVYLLGSYFMVFAYGRYILELLHITKRLYR